MVYLQVLSSEKHKIWGFIYDQSSFNLFHQSSNWLFYQGLKVIKKYFIAILFHLHQWNLFIHFNKNNYVAKQKITLYQ